MARPTGPRPRTAWPSAAPRRRPSARLHSAAAAGRSRSSASIASHSVASARQAAGQGPARRRSSPCSRSAAKLACSSTPGITPAVPAPVVANWSPSPAAVAPTMTMWSLQQFGRHFAGEQRRHRHGAKGAGAAAIADQAFPDPAQRLGLRPGGEGRQRRQAGGQRHDMRPALGAIERQVEAADDAILIRLDAGMAGLRGIANGGQQRIIGAADSCRGQRIAAAAPPCRRGRGRRPAPGLRGGAR